MHCITKDSITRIRPQKGNVNTAQNGSAIPEKPEIPTQGNCKTVEDHRADTVELFMRLLRDYKEGGISKLKELTFNNDFFHNFRFRGNVFQETNSISFTIAIFCCNFANIHASPSHS